MERVTGITSQVIESAQEGDAKMQYMLASYLYVGDSRKAPNPEQGFGWMRASAQNGCVKAMKVLALLYTNGQHAPYPAQDFSEAYHWYEEAAKQGDAEAMYWTSCCLRKGVGVRYNDERADYWLDQAVKHGYHVENDGASEEEAMDIEQARTTSQARPWEQYDLQEEGGVRPSNKNPQERTQVKRKEKKQHRTLKEKSLDIAKDGNNFTPKHDLAYARMAAIYGVIALSAVTIFCCILAVIIHGFNKDFFAGSGRTVFLLIAVVLVLGLTALAVRNGYLSAYEEAVRSAWFRNTSFYEQYRLDYEKLNDQALMEFEYYEALSKTFRPVAYTEVIPRVPFRDTRGYIFMGLYFGERGQSACPEFVIVTEKTIYVILCREIHGKIYGDVSDPEWRLLTGSGKSKKMENLLAVNEKRIQCIRKDLSRICPWAVTEALPIFSMAVIDTGCDLSDLTGERRDVNHILMQASSEEVRGFIEVQESKKAIKEEEARELLGAMEQIAGEFEKRRSSMGREAI